MPAGVSAESGSLDASVFALTSALEAKWHPDHHPQGRDVLLGNETLPNERELVGTRCVSSLLDQPLLDIPVLQAQEKDELILIGQLCLSKCTYVDNDC